MYCYPWKYSHDSDLVDYNTASPYSFSNQSSPSVDDASDLYAGGSEPSPMMMRFGAYIRNTLLLVSFSWLTTSWIRFSVTLYGYTVSFLTQRVLKTLLGTADMYARVHCEVTTYATNLYSRHSVVKWGVDGARYWMYRAYCVWNRITVEPLIDEYTCVIGLDDTDTYQEEYVPWLHLQSLQCDSDEAYRRCLWIYRSREKSYHIRYFRDMMECMAPVPSDVRFLCVEYYHPQMAKPLSLDVPYEMYYIGNHLFTPMWVLYMLRHTYSPHQYVFDMNYSLHLMDIDLRFFTLQSFQWIRLERNLYVTDAHSSKRVPIPPSKETPASQTWMMNIGHLLFGWKKTV